MIRKIIKLLLTIYFPLKILTITAEPNSNDVKSNSTILEETNYEPKVTEEEGKLLRKVIEIAQTSIDDAIKTIEENIVNESSAPIYFALGTLYYSKNYLESAESNFRKALTLSKNFLRAKGSLAQILIQKGEYNNAIKLFSDVLLHGNPKPSTLTMIGYAYLMKEQPIPAENAYRQALLIDGGEENTYLGLANSLIQQERYRESISIIRQLIKTNTNKKELWLMLSNIYQNLEEYDNAISVLESARRLNLLNNSGLANLGDLYIHKEMLNEAISVYKEAFKENEIEVSRVLRAAEGFVINLDTESAKTIFKIIENCKIKEENLKENEKETLLLLQGRCFHIDKKYNEAILTFKKILEMNPMNSEALLALGDILKEQLNFEEAMLYYERAKRAGKVTSKALIRQAQIEVERENYKNAILLLEEALIIEPDTYVSRYLSQIRNIVSM